MARLTSFALGLGLGAALLSPSGAAASCAGLTPREELAQAAAAFIGQPVESRGDRIEYQVIQAAKGQFGDQVEVRDEFPGTTSIGNLPATPGQTVALFLRGDAVSGFSSNACLSIPADAMRAAAASGRTRCLVPRVLELRVTHQRGRRVLLRVGARDGDDPVDRVVVNWSDGKSTRVRFGAAPSVVIAHRYARSGVRTVEVVAQSQTTLDCTLRGQGSRRQVSAIRRQTLVVD